MKKPVKKLLSFLCICTMTLSALPESGLFNGTVVKADGPLNYYVCPNSMLVKETDSDYSGMVNKGTLSFSMAANERESGQIVLAPINNFTTFNYSCFEMSLKTDFIGPKNQRISKDNFEIYFEHYVKVEPYWELKGSGSYPDLLIPYGLATDKQISSVYRANNFSLNGQGNYQNGYKRNQGLWFTMTAPKGTQPGRYTAQLECSFGLASSTQNQKVVIPVEVNIYGFELDTVTKSRTNFESSPGHLPSSNDDRVSKLSEIVGMSASDKDDATLKYQTEICNFLDERKLSNGFNQGIFYNADSLDSDIDKLVKYIRNSETKAPYYNIYHGFFDGGTESGNSLVSLTYTKTPDAVVKEFTDKTGITLSERAKILFKDALKNASSVDSSRTYGSVTGALRDISKTDPKATDSVQVKNEKTYNKTMASFYLYLLTSNQSVNRYPVRPGTIGLQMVMEKLVDRSVSENFDLLQYGFVRVPQIDEPEVDSFKHNVSNLLSSYVVEETKADIKKYIENNQALSSNPELRSQLLKSLENIHFLSTASPYDESGKMSDMLNNGLKAISGSEVWKYYKQFRNKNYPSYSDGLVQAYPYYKDGKMTPYTVNVPLDYSMKSFCPLFNDFSTNKNVIEHETTLLGSRFETYKQNGTNFWWYSTLTSGMSPALAGYMINENQATANGNSLSALAIARTNKWNQFYKGIKGELFWGVDVCFRNENGTEVLKTDIGLTAKGQDDGTAADGMLMYPTKQILKNVYKVTDQNKMNSLISSYGYFLSSVRMENIAEANDDYDYLSLAQSLFEQRERDGMSVNSYKSVLNNNCYSYMMDPGSVEYGLPRTTPEHLISSRENLAKIIENMSTESVAPTGSRFYTKKIDSVLGWKQSNASICFDFKATDTIKSSSSNNVTIYIQSINAQTREWEGIAKEYTFNVANGTSSIGKVSSLGNGWYRAEIPFKSFEVKSSASDGMKSADVVGFTWVNRSFDMRNFKIVY